MATILRSREKTTGTVVKAFNNHEVGDEVRFSVKLFRELKAKGLVTDENKKAKTSETPEEIHEKRLKKLEKVIDFVPKETIEAGLGSMTDEEFTTILNEAKEGEKAFKKADKSASKNKK